MLFRSLLSEATNKTNDFEKLLDSAETPEWYIPNRPLPENCGPDLPPNLKLKILVSINSNYIDTINFDQRTGERLPSTPIPQVDKEIILSSSNIRKVFSKTSDILRKYDEIYLALIEETDQDPLFNLSDEAELVDDFLGSLERLLSINGFSILSYGNDRIVIGIDENKKIKYVLYDNGRETINLKTGFRTFVGSDGPSVDQTVNFVYHANAISEIPGEYPEMILQEFMERYCLYYPDISYKPKEQQELAAKDAKLFTSAGYPDFKRQSSDSEYEAVLEELDSQSYATEEDLKRQDLFFKSYKFKAKASKKNRARAEFVGDLTLSGPNVDKILDELKSIDDIFYKLRMPPGRWLAYGINCLVTRLCSFVVSFLKQLPYDKLIEQLANIINIKIEDVLLETPILRNFFQGLMIN